MFEKQMNSVFGESFLDDYIHRELVPLSHLIEKDSKWILEVDLPFVNRKDIDITLSPHHLTIKAKLEKTFCVSKFNCTVEFDYFKKVISIPDGIDEKKILAKFRDGILTIVIPKITVGKKIPIE